MDKNIAVFLFGLLLLVLFGWYFFTDSERVKRNPRWGWRLIDNEEWAITPPKKSPVGELTTRRAPVTDAEPVEAGTSS